MFFRNDSDHHLLKAAINTHHFKPILYFLCIKECKKISLTTTYRAISRATNLNSHLLLSYRSKAYQSNKFKAMSLTWSHYGFLTTPINFKSSNTQLSLIPRAEITRWKSLQKTSTCRLCLMSACRRARLN